jgi:PilZ domain
MATQAGLRRESQTGSRASQEKAIFRRWQRYRLNLPIRLIVTRDEGTRIAEGRANDISEGGMLIFAGIELRADDKVQVEFTPPYSSSPVRAPGIVRHRRGYNYGVEFGSETRSDQEQTERFRNLLQLAAGDAQR